MDPKNSGQSLVAALQSRPPLTLTINTIRDYVSMYMQLFTPLYVTSDHYDMCTFVPFAAGNVVLVVDMIKPDAFVGKGPGSGHGPLTPTRGRSRAGFRLLKTLGLSHDRDGRRGLPAQE